MNTVVVNKLKDSYDVYIGRGSKWGNPYSFKPNTLAEHRVRNRQEAINAYYLYITSGEGKHLLNDLSELSGKRLGCYCYPKPCHGDILVDLIKNKILFDLLS